jgi:hypothetical protein
VKPGASLFLIDCEKDIPVGGHQPDGDQNVEPTENHFLTFFWKVTFHAKDIGEMVERKQRNDRKDDKEHQNHDFIPPYKINQTLLLYQTSGQNDSC